MKETNTITSAHVKDDFQYILDLLKNVDVTEQDLWSDMQAFVGADEEIDMESLLDDIELCLHSALLVHTFDKDGENLRCSMQKIASYAATLPPEVIRPALRKTSPRIDALLAFTDLWQSSCRAACFRDETSGADDLLSDFLFEGRSYEGGNGNEVPYLAFLLAGTDFPFTEEELSEIRSGAGTSVGELLGNARGKEGGA